jgi:hypothetical protein
MAFPADAGDISQISEYGRFAIPGAGHNLAGAAKNNKVMVWGRIKGLYNSTGLDLNERGGLRALGVSTVDYFSFTVRQTGSAGTTNPTDLKLFLADLEQGVTTPGKIFVADEAGTDAPAEPSNSDIITIDYLIVGEDVTAPELV